eukprot:gnl/TRDRNA2_/TRDRNA2_185831_c0_seq1.p1 gnl/TRDRNA2_/TRDRNA2_185831_c0~~gnl/TRDRNA2_/TRDRNA2_185831_c0_seq1.p1  ORF type:complete len:140 (-),score=33.01 gnl/TRDRNA2_/TRDRNA2_185831_c0_seq1:62-481(-)
MPDLASKKSGGKVLMVSSEDDEHSGDNVIDGNDNSYWISTGLYPQELLLQLSAPASVSNLKLSSTYVRAVRIEGCCEDSPVNFKTIAEGDMDKKAADGRLQIKDFPLKSLEGPVSFVKVQLLSGWHDFCSVHKIQVDSA